MGTIPQSGDELAMAFAAAKTLLDQDRLDDAARLAGRLVRDHGGGSGGCTSSPPSWPSVPVACRRR